MLLRQDISLGRVQMMLKTKTTHDLNQLSDGWVIANPNTVSIDHIKTNYTVLYATLQSPSSIRLDRLEWSSDSDKVC